MRFRITELEERIVLDAAVVNPDAGDDHDDALDAQPEAAVDAPDAVAYAPDAGASAPAESVQVLLVSSRIQDGTDLAAAAGDNVRVVEYDAATTTLDTLLASVETVLAGDKADSIAIAAHDVGVGGFSLVDGVEVNADSVAGQDAFWSSLGTLLDADGRIDLLACDLAAGEDGAALVDALEGLTGVNVAASTDATGNGDGADWILETDNIDVADIYFRPETLSAFEGQLAGNTPVFDTAAVTDALENTAFTYDLSATDPEGDAIDFQAVTVSTDQSNVSGSPASFAFLTSDWQSFTAGTDGWLTSVDLYQYSATVGRTLTIYAGEGTGGEALYQQHFDAGGSGSSWRSFEFDAGVELQAGQQYTIEWDANGASAGIFMDLGSNDYAGGEAGFLGSFDYFFRTNVAQATPDALPDWLSLTDNGDGSASLSGTPDATDLGDHDIMLLAADGTTAALQSFSVHVNDMPLVSSILKNDPEPVTVDTASYQVEFSESVTGVDVTDFAVVGSGVSGTVLDVSGSGSVYTVTVGNISGQGDLRLDLVDNDSILDADGTALGGEGLGNGDFIGGETYIVDLAPPEADIVDVAPDPGNGDAGVVSVVFSEDVSGVDISDFSLTRDGAAVDLSGLAVNAISGSEYAIDLSTVTGAEGTYVLSLNASGSGIADAAGNLMVDDASDIWSTDTTPPTANLSEVADLVNTDAGQVTVAFSEAVTGVDLGDFALTRDGMAVDLSGAALTQVDGATYTLDLAGVTDSDGAYVLSLLPADIQDAAGNALAAGVSESWTADLTAPEAALADLPVLTNADAGIVTVTFSEDVAGVDLGDFTLIRDGVAVDLSGAALTQISGSEYELDLSSVTNADGAYVLNLNASGSGITDAAGNLLTADVVEAWTADMTAPTADVEEVLPDPNNIGAGEVSVWFSEDVSGVDIGDFTLTRDGVAVDISGVTLTEVSASEYELDLTWVTNVEGAYVLTVNAAGSGIADAAGNLFGEDAFDAWETDMTGPASDIVAPPAIANAPTGDVAVIFSEDVTGVDASDFTLTRDGVAVDLSGVTVTQVSGSEYALDLSSVTNADGAYELTLTATGSGIVDAVGNELVFDTSEQWAIDMTAPEAALADLPVLTNADAGVVAVSFSEDVSGVDLADFTLTRDGVAVDLSGVTVTQVSGSEYALDLSSVTDIDGAYVLSLNASGSGITDAAGNEVLADASEAWTADMTAPDAALSGAPVLTNTDAGVVTVAFSENVSGVDLADFTLTRDGVAVDLSEAALTQVDGATYEIDLSAVTAAEGEYVLTLSTANGDIVDAAGNALAADASEAWTADMTAPDAVFSPVSADGIVTITFSEAVSGVDINDFTLLVNGQAVDMSGLEVVKVSDTEYAIDVSSVVGGGTQTVTLVADGSGIADAAGNALAEDTSLTWTTDGDAPEVVSIVRADDAPVHVKGDTAVFTVTFTEAVSGVDAGDFQVVTNGNLTGSVTAVTEVSAGVYEVTVGGMSGAGRLELAVVDNDTIHDAAGNELGGDGAGNGDFADGEHYTVNNQVPHCNPWMQLVHRIVVHVVRHMHQNWGLWVGLHNSFVHAHQSAGSPFAQEIHDAHVSMRDAFSGAASAFRGSGWGSFGGHGRMRGRW